jgi:uncharacterized HAD superfamily protein
MQIIIDLDGTICSEEKTFSRSLAKPKKDAVETINAWYDEGHTIIIYTARTWMEFEMTTDWLNKNKVKYHQLFMGKPVGDVWIDDRALAFDGNWKGVYQSLKNKSK